MESCSKEILEKNRKVWQFDLCQSHVLEIGNRISLFKRYYISIWMSEVETWTWTKTHIGKIMAAELWFSGSREKKHEEDQIP